MLRKKIEEIKEKYYKLIEMNLVEMKNKIIKYLD